MNLNGHSDGVPPTSSHTITQEDSTFRLDSEVESKINELRRLQKIAFLSGKERTYFPEDSGYSRFGIKNKPFGDPSIPPPTLFIPPEQDRLEKPISLKGYGIGGLSQPRFKNLNSNLKNPAPNKYKTEQQILLGREHRFPPQVWMNYGLLSRNEPFKTHLPKVTEKLTSLWNKCQQVRAPFLNSMKRPRFGKAPKWNLVGPGHYEIGSFKRPRAHVNNSFMRGPVMLNPPTKLHCSHGPKGSCVECGKELESSEDYYRTKYRLRLPPPRIGVTASTNEEDEIARKVVDKSDEAPPRRKRVLLCRVCHCKALRGESKYWKRKLEVEWLFEKTRHCGYIHEHNGLPDFTEKASCYWTKRLARKESMLEKYYPDKCERRMLKRKTKDGKTV